MWTLSGFSDEISPDLEEQCTVLNSLGLSFLEFRSAWDVNVLDLDAVQLKQAKQVLDQHGLQVSSIGSPIGKIFVNEDFKPHLERAKHAVQVAHHFGATYVRVFSFFIPKGDDPDEHRDEVLRRMHALTEVATSGNVVFIHENEKAIYGDIPRRCLDIVESVDSAHLRIAWDAANFVQVGVHPHTDAFHVLRPYLEYVQIKDAVLDTGEVVSPGTGDGQIVETMKALHADGFDGFFSLEPHLSQAHELGGFSGPELFTEAFEAFTGILRAEQIPYQ